LLKFEGITNKSDTIHTYIQSDKWTKIGADVRICLGKVIFSYTGSPQLKENRNKFFWGEGLLF